MFLVKQLLKVQVVEFYKKSEEFLGQVFIMGQELYISNLKYSSR